MISNVKQVVLSCAAAVTVAAQLPAHGEQPASVEEFRPAGISQPVYGVDPAVDERWISTSDGLSVYVKVTHPVGTSDHSLPRRRPTILVATAYSGVAMTAFVTVGDPDAQTEPELIDDVIAYFVPRGYSVAVTDVVGTGASGGCFDFGGPREVRGIMAAVDHLGDASWSNGRVGMFGGSYTGGTQFAAATSALPGSEFLKAIIPVSAQSGAYEFITMGDGVPLGSSYSAGTIPYPLALGALASGPRAQVGPGGARTPECLAAHTAESARIGTTGDYTPWSAEREWRHGMANVRAATLMFHGFGDANVYVTPTLGSFEQIPAATPKKLVMGQWEHSFGTDTRGDVWQMWHAWYDRYLMHLPTHVEQWPDVQVQDSDGQWREQASWPTSGGRPGQLTLTAAGRLGGETPTGESTFIEGTGGLVSEAAQRPETPVEADGVVFRSGALDAPLHITGVPVLDLWVEIDTPSDRGDAHIAAILRALDREGQPVGKPAYWARSVQHLEPITRGFFEQRTGRKVEEKKPIRVPIRLMPTDVTVPAGGHLELRVAGTVRPLPDSAPYFMSAPSGADAHIRILHDCTGHVSVLRFLMPDPDSRVLDVAAPETATARRPAQTRQVVGTADGAGAAVSPICGAPPEDPATVLASPQP